MNKTIKIAAALGALAVVIGAFGAHSLKPMLIETGRLATFETAVEYHFYHVLALFLIGLLQNQNNHKYLSWSANAMLIGLILFSGSLYILCMTRMTYLGAITPIGGIFFIIGWVLLFMTKKSPAN